MESLWSEVQLTYILIMTISIGIFRAVDIGLHSRDFHTSTSVLSAMLWVYAQFFFIVWEWKSDSFDKAYSAFLHSSVLQSVVIHLQCVIQCVIHNSLYHLHYKKCTNNAIYILLYFLHCNVFALHCADALISKDCCEEQFVNILFPWIDSQRFGLKSQRFHKSSKNAPYFKAEEVFLLKDFFLKKAVPY